MAGLTIGLFSLDRLGLEVLIRSGETREQRLATRILPLVKKEHLLLVTLLLVNAIANEALPIFLDKLLSPVWAIVVSVSLVLVFGEIIPQALFKEHALLIGATLAPLVHVLLAVCYPIAWPISKLLDSLLGSGDAEEVEYKRKQLKTFVRLHGKTEGRGGVLTSDETTMIDGVLELSEKKAVDVMVPIASVYALSEDTLLDRETLINISRSGHSRIPIYTGTHPDNLQHILLVKDLITEDLHSEHPPYIRDLHLHALPTKHPDTPLFSMLDFFQEGKSHLVLLCTHDDGTNRRSTVGIVTLEDVVEELIKEEIYDETDVSPTNSDAQESSFASLAPSPPRKLSSKSRQSSFSSREKARVARPTARSLNGEGVDLEYGSSSSGIRSRNASAESEPLLDL